MNDRASELTGEPTDYEPERYLRALQEKLRRRRIMVGREDIAAVRQALHAGFGWGEPVDLCRLLCRLWAKSREEETIIRALFPETLAELKLTAWSLVPEDSSPAVADSRDAGTEKEPGAIRLKPYPESEENEQTENRNQEKQEPTDREPEPYAHDLSSGATTSSDSERSPTKGGRATSQTPSLQDFPPITIDPARLAKRSFIFTHAFPMSQREIAQTWRRLKFADDRSGPKTLPDIPATLREIVRQGGTAPVVMRSQRSYTLRLRLLIDRGGSMNPFHLWCDHFVQSLVTSGRLGSVQVAYFHDTPVITPPSDDNGGHSPDAQRWVAELAPPTDYIIPYIAPVDPTRTLLFEDADLRLPILLEKLQTELQEETIPCHATVIVSDAGADDLYFSGRRFVDTIALLKGLGHDPAGASRLVWLNPFLETRWKRRTNTTCSEMARYVPMFSMDRMGMAAAVTHLRRGLMGIG